MRKLIILQTVIPDYRSKVFTYLKTELKSSFVLFGGQCYFEETVKSDYNFPFFNKVKNFYFFNRRLLFQLGFWRVVAQNNVMVIELNPRIISNWIILIVRKLLKKKTVLWGHAWPRLGPESNTDRIREYMRNLADTIIVYTATQKRELQNKMPNAKILYAPNSIYFKSDMSTNLEYNEIKNIIYVGRLTVSKKAIFLVKAFKSILNEVPIDAKLIIVGEGGEKSLIIDYIKKNELSNRIKVLGHIGDYKSLKKLYNSSLFSVSPGYVGLSITQSFSFGVPMLVSRDECHSPEIEAVIENENAVFFKTDSIDGLSEEIMKFYKNRKFWIGKRQKTMEFCRDNYSIEAMAKSFKEVLFT